MENDWEILDDFEWVQRWFVWLRIFNNFVNMVIWTFWTLSLGYTFWLFFFTKEMHFLSYYVFLYSMYVNIFALVYLDDYLYFSARRNRDEERRIRIEKARKNDRLHAVKVRTQKLMDRVNLYPNITEYVLSSKRQFSPIQIMALLARERRRAVDKKQQEIEEFRKQSLSFETKNFEEEISLEA